MFDLIDGLPVHPLVVHALAVLAVSVVLMPVATSSGESLEKHVGDPGEHAELGDQLIWFAIPLLIIVAVMVYLDRRPRPGAPTWLPTALTVLAIVVGLANVVQVYRVGDSGARAAWGDQVTSSSGSQGGDGD